ncbi:universal stress protein [Aestuariirhabdus litorea]|uniref:Universal stress protein n=1 Tax=Aestuariirhabdus litorea TaxID=2528527 RepID=A0A3P3VMW6_9GAMM|nr:universal stress protein [Aestuariirhabdus litorea]RRJ84035.1 universal stress protein [Aestuariirhabdus litorea]RWW97256.1 universal stress protein [Endozoicomonadaceae bacterium GTF-13]
MFTKILLPVDLSNDHPSQKALDAAIFQARASNASLHLLAVIPGFSMPMVSTYMPRDLMSKAHSEVKTRLRAFAEKYIPDEIDCTLAVTEGTAYKRILKEIEREGVDLVIMANHDSRKIDHFFLGSVTSKVAEHCKTNLLIIKD